MRYILLTGEPGAGKTTLTKKIVSRLQEKGVKTAGFYTEEVRTNGVREGFDVINLDGKRGRLARDLTTLTSPNKYKVGKYGVLVQEFEDIALDTLDKATTDDILVVDEIGKMEFFSTPFKDKIKLLFSTNSQFNILATIPVRKSDSLIESIRCNPQAHVYMVTRENRNRLQEDIVQQILDMRLNNVK